MKQISHTTSPLILWGRILFVAFGIVYTLFFSLVPNKDVFATQNNNQEMSSTGSKNSTIVRLQIEQNQSWALLWEIASGNTWEIMNENSFVPSVLPRTPKHIVSTQELFFGKQQSVPLDKNSIQSVTNTVLWPDYPGMLSFPWTHHRRWTMKSASFIGFANTIKYVLKNNDNTHFAYVWNDLPDVADAVWKLWWKTVAFTDKKDINTHWLFGDKVIFLQIPQYLGKKQLFFVYFSEERDRWFIQVDNDIFETTKPLLRELYAKRYNR